MAFLAVYPAFEANTYRFLTNCIFASAQGTTLNR